MEEPEFKKFLHQGLGRVILFLMQHDAAPYREAILDACLHNRAYDPQVEGSRADYMHEVIELTGEVSDYRGEILKSLASSNEHWDTGQLFGLAGIFARHGDGEARQAMYARFRADCAQGHEVGIRALLELDNTDALIFIANYYGERLLAGADCDFDDYLLTAASYAGISEPWAVLRNAAAEHPPIQAYLTEVQRKLERRQALKTEPPTRRPRPIQR